MKIEKSKRKRKVSKILGDIGFAMLLLLVGFIYAIAFFWIFYNYLPK